MKQVNAEGKVKGMKKRKRQVTERQIIRSKWKERGKKGKRETQTRSNAAYNVYPKVKLKGLQIQRQMNRQIDTQTKVVKTQLRKISSKEMDKYDNY